MDIIETPYYLKLSEFGKSFFSLIVINDMHKRCLDQSYVEMQSHLLSFKLMVHICYFLSRKRADLLRSIYKNLF